MEIFSSSERKWFQSPYPNVYYSQFRPHKIDSKSGSMLLRLKKGAVVPSICYQGGRQLFMLYGQILINDNLLNRGDLVLVSENNSHRIEALEDSMYITFFDAEIVETANEEGEKTTYNLFESFELRNISW